uniref:Uncharacterized protein n=1 Tax=Arundo donax TaxID=35708 RepID=A0A0A8YL62_ARUDO
MLVRSTSQMVVNQLTKNHMKNKA